MFLQLASLLLTFGVGLNNIQPVDPGQYFSTDFTVENHVLVSVNDKAAKEIRIYKDSGITTIDEHAFDGCSFDSVMISDCVTTINAEISENVLVKFTKAKSSYSFDLPENVQYLEHSCDEGFLNYWTENIRDDIDGSICNVSIDNYRYVKELYSNLNNYDKFIVENTIDGDATIKESLKFLDSQFSSTPSESNSREISKGVMISLILVIASFGMTAIGIFYVLKDKKVIK